MWNADRYNKALRFAGEWHEDQTVPGTSISYLMHLTQVCQQALLGALTDPELDINLVMECAILHDVLEDTKCPFQTLKEEFGERTANGVLALSKHKYKDGVTLSKREQMLDSLERIQQQPKEVWLVKLADRITNLQKPPAHWYKKEGKIAGYLNEAHIISDYLASSNAFLDNALSQKMRDYQQYI